jgi:hypothetical protein
LRVNAVSEEDADSASPGGSATAPPFGFHNIDSSQLNLPSWLDSRETMNGWQEHTVSRFDMEISEYFTANRNPELTTLTYLTDVSKPHDSVAPISMLMRLYGDLVSCAHRCI